MEARKDRFFRGKIRILQPRKGYRFSLDTVLLASWAEIFPEELGLELGGGFGPASIMVKFLNPGAKIISIDIIEDYLKLFKQSLSLNKFSEVYPVCGDIKLPPFKEKFNYIFFNPPYLEANKYRVSPKREIALSKYEIGAKLEDFFLCSQSLLKKNGRVYFIVGSQRKDAEDIFKKMGFFTSEALEIFDGNEEKFRIFTLRKEKSKGLIGKFKMKKGGKYTQEMKRILEGEKLRKFLPEFS